MNGRKAKLAAGATVLGLGALGGMALGTNPGIPTVAQQAAPGARERIVTGASGSTTAVTRPVALRTGSSTHPPIVTHASGGDPRPASVVDD